MKPPRGGRRLNSLRRAFALGTCLGPVGHLAAAGLGPRETAPVHAGPRDPAPLPPFAVVPFHKPDFAPPRDGTVGVVGGGYYTDAIVTLLDEVGVPVGFLVDDLDGADGDPFGAVPALARRGIPLLTAEQFVERSRAAGGRLTLVAGRVACELPLAVADDPLHIITEWVARVAAGQDPPLHPAAFLALADPLPCPDRYAVLGFPGSGNVLTQNLIEAMFARQPREVPLAWRVRSGLVEQHFYGLWARVHAALAPLAPTRVEFIPYDFGTMRVSVECGDRAGVVYDVPSDRHAGLQAFPTHSRPYRRAVDYFAAAGAPCVVVVRHPLETLLSGANKIERPARPVLDGGCYLDHAPADLADWTAHLLAHRGRVHVVRYEDLAARRTDVLRGLAAFVGHPVTDGEATALLDRFLNRNLTAATEKHFFRGGSDKWRGELEPRDLRRALARLPAAAFTAFGYAVPTEADLSPVPVPARPMPRSELYACLLGAYPLRPVPGPHGMRVTGSDGAMVAGLAAAFQDPAVLAHLAAGGLTGPALPAGVSR